MKQNKDLDLAKYKPNREFLLYKTPDRDVKEDVLLQNETIWIPKKKIAELFDVNVPAVSKHLKNTFESGELLKEATVSIMEIVQNESGRKVKRSNEY
jgi:hypothetical protein